MSKASRNTGELDSCAWYAKEQLPHTDRQAHGCDLFVRLIVRARLVNVKPQPKQREVSPFNIVCDAVFAPPRPVSRHTHVEGEGKREHAGLPGTPLPEGLAICASS